MFNKKNLFIIVLTIALFIYFQSGINYVSVEELSVPSGIGLDIEYDSSGKIRYITSTLTYNFKTAPQVSTMNFPASASTIAETRQTRQPKLDKKFILGLERIIITSEKGAKFGVEPWINILFANPNVSDTGYFVVSKERAMDILAVKIPGYPGSADYIEGMIRHSTEFNFFTDKYKLIDIYISIAGEGKNVVVPYIEIQNNNLRITGMAVFKKDKFVRKLDLSEARTMNLLRENKVRGMLNIQKGPKEFVEFNATSKRKVKCKKTGKDKYSFTIDLSIKGNIVSNLIYDDIYDDPKVAKKFEAAMNKEVEKMCNEFIEKMQKEYKQDLLQLGSIAAAKYGRNKGTDWDEVVSNSKIKVNVETKLDVQSRGDYRVKNKNDEKSK